MHAAPLFRERVPHPPPDMLFPSRRAVLAFSLGLRAFAALIVLSLPFFVSGGDPDKMAFRVDPKAVGSAIDALLIFAVFWIAFTDIDLCRPLLRATTPIVLTRDTLALPTSLFERLALGRRFRVPLSEVEEVRLAFRKDRARDRDLAEVTVLLRGGRRRNCGAKLAKEMEALGEALRGAHPSVRVVAGPPT